MFGENSFLSEIVT